MRPRSMTYILFLVLLPGLVSYAGEKTFEQSFDVGDGGKLVLNTDFGDVKITGTSGSKVNVKAVMRGTKSNLEDFKITAEKSGSTVEVVGKAGEQGWLSEAFEDLSVVYTIEVPKEFDIKASTAGGDVAIREVKGMVEGETSGGDVDFQNIEGEMKAETSGGDITANDVTGNLRAETSGGDVSVIGANGNVKAETSGGDILVKGVAGNVSAETSGGDIVVAVSGENRGVMAETSGGDIEILAYAGIKANLDASTSGGSVVCKIPITLAGEIDESEIRGTLNGGGELIKAHTSGGDITIRSAE